jgi:hypothetical protein
MARHGTLSRRPAKEQPPTDMRDDKTVNTIADQTNIPLPSVAPSIPCPTSDRCPTEVPVGGSRRSAPTIRRFCPVLRWWTMFQLLARRVPESNTFSVPDRNELWSRVEDGLLVQTVAKNSTSDVLGRDWSEVTSELPGRSKEQCKESYRFADTVTELTFVFIRVIFLGSPAFRSSLVLTKVTDSADSARPIHYSTFDVSPPSPDPSLSPTSSLTYVHRYIGSRSATRQTLPTSAKLTYLSVYDSRDGVSEHTASPSPPSSFTYVHRYIGSHNATRQTLPTSAKLTYLSVYDRRDSVSERAAYPSPPSSLTHVHRYIGSRNATRQTLPTSAKLTHLSVYDRRDGVSDRAAVTPLLSHACTQVHRFSQRNPTDAAYLCETDVSKCV